MVAACGYQHIRLYDLASANPDPVHHFEGVNKNVSRVGFQVRLKNIDIRQLGGTILVVKCVQFLKRMKESSLNGSWNLAAYCI